MPQSPNKITQFWQELKRRKVVRVITVYAAAAFVILELVDIITEPLRLPEWTLQFAIVFLCIGFIIAIIFSWIYDVKPEGGLEKTQPAHKVNEEDKPKSSNSWKIASYISFVVIVGLIILNIIPRTNTSKKVEILDKSITVLPFISLSDDPEKQYLADGIMDAILLHLSKIEDLRVLARTTSEKYRDTDKTATEICQELGVSFALEGSFRKYGDQARLIVQLIRSGKEDHAWAKQYDREWKDIFTVESEVAQAIAKELQAVITPEEKQLIESIPTKSLDALEYYLLGKHHLNTRPLDEDIWQAIEYFQQAIDVDTAYALAYAGLAKSYYQLTNRAIVSPKEAYPQAKVYSIKALEINEKLADTHSILGLVKQSFEYDFDGAEKNYIRALEINPRSHSAQHNYARYLSIMGRHEEAISHADVALELDPLSFSAKVDKYVIQFIAGYKSEALKLMEEIRDSYPDNPLGYWFCAIFYTDLEMYKEALSMLQTQITLMGNDNVSDEIALKGFIYGRMGQSDKAQEQLNQLDTLSSKGYYIAPRTRVWFYLGLNDVDGANEILEKSFEEHSIDPLYLQLFPSDFILNDLRFAELQKKIGIKH